MRSADMQTAIHPRILKARRALVTRGAESAFYGTLLMYLRPVELPESQCPTMATDGVHLFYSVAFVDSIPDDELEGVLVHEVAHCANCHHTRRNGRDPDLWNQACDYAINPPILAAGFRLPSWVLNASRFNGLNAEQIYRQLKQDDSQKQDSGDDNDSGDDDSGEDGTGGDDDSDNSESDDGTQSGDNSGDESAGDKSGDDSESGQDGAAGQSQGNPGRSAADGAPGQSGGPQDGAAKPGQDGAPNAGQQPGQDTPRPRQPITDPGRCGGVLDAAPMHDGAETSEKESDWQARVRQAAAIAKRTCGDMPGSIAKLVTELSKPRLDARELLRRFINDSNSRDYSWTHPSRRHLSGGRILPGLVPDRPSHVVGVIDTSISITDAEIGFFISELQNALDSGAADKITIGLADIELYASGEFRPGDTIRIPEVRRGGTAYDHALAWVAENCADASAILYLTDCECYQWGEEPAAPLIWIVTGHPEYARRNAESAPFGDSVILEDCDY